MKLPLSHKDLAGLQSGDLLHVVEVPRVTMTQLAFYCAATGVTDPIHFDRRFARETGFADAVVNGSLRGAWLAHAASGLVAAPHHLARLECSHRGVMLVGQSAHIEVRFDRLQQADDHALLCCTMESRVDAALVDVGQAQLRLLPSSVLTST